MNSLANLREQQRDQVRIAEEATTQSDRTAANNRAEILNKQIMRVENEIANLEGKPNLAGLRNRSLQAIRDYVAGKTSNQLSDAISKEEQTIRELKDQLARYEASNTKADKASLWEADEKLLGEQIGMTAEHRKEVRELKSKINQLTHDRITPAQAESLRERIRDKQLLIDVLRSDSTRKLMEQQQRYRDMISRNTALRQQNHQNAAMQRTVGHVAKRLDKLIRNEQDMKHVPEELKPYVYAALAAITDNDSRNGIHSLVFSTKDAQTLNDFYARRVAEAGAYSDDSFLADTVADLQAAMQTLRNAQLDAKPADGESILQARARERGVALEVIRDSIKVIEGTVKAQNKLFLQQGAASVAEKGDRFISEVASRKDAKTHDSAAGKAVQSLDKLILTGNTTPVYFFRRMGNSVLTELNDAIRDGQNEYGLRVARVRNDFAAIGERHHAANWDMNQRMVLDTQGGDTVSITLGQAMSLAATWIREHSNPDLQSQHLEVGGFVLSEQAKADKGRWQTMGVQMTEADYNNLMNMLSADQQAYMNEMVSYMSNELSDYGNETSMKLYGIKLFKEQNYIPFVSDPSAMYKASNVGANAQDASRIKHPGFSNRRISNANNALIIDDFLTVCANHAQQMINYSTMAIPIENMNKVLNYRQSSDGTRLNPRVRQIFQQKYGNVALGYLQDYLKDLNGGVQADNRGATDKLLSAYKKAAVSASLSVAAQQPLSYIRAAVEINPVYLVQAMGQIGTSTGDYDELMKYSGVAVIKSMGKFDTGVGMSATEYIANAQETAKGFDKVRDTVDEIAGWLPEKADQATWVKMWKAVKLEQQAMHPDMDHNSEAFLKLCGDRFNNVMDLTQIYDSVLTRSSNMRSKNAIAKMSTAFMAEPTLTANVLYDAFTRLKESGGKTRAAMAVSTFLVSAVAQSVIKALFSSIRKKVGKDDEDTATIEELFASYFTGSLLDEINPINSVAYLRDAWGVLTGEDLERTDLSILTSLVDTAEKVVNGKYTFNNWSDAWYSIEGITKPVANALGIPVGNLSREARAIVQAAYRIKRELNGEIETNMETIKYNLANGLNVTILGKTFGWDSGKSAYYERYLDAVREGRTDEANELRVYLMDNGGANVSDEDKFDAGLRKAVSGRVKDGSMTVDEAVDFAVSQELYKDKKSAYSALAKTEAKQAGNDEFTVYDDAISAAVSGDKAAVDTAITALEGHGYDRKSAVTSTTTAVKKQYMAGEIDQATAEKAYKALHPDKDANAVYWTMDEWSKTAEHSGDDGWQYKKYADLTEAVSSGKNIRAVVKEYTAHGTSKDGITDALRNTFKPILQDNKKNGRSNANLQSYIIDALEAAGYKRAKAQQLVKGWLNPKKK